MKLVIENLSKSFDDKEVIKDASYEFEKGLVYALLGRNGAGKTTLFRLITEAIKKDSGEIYIEENGTQAPVSFDDVFMMVDIDYYLDLVDFDKEDSHRLIQSYSTGMKNKIQMLMFLILKPRIILMDEPLTSLDVVVSLQMKKIIRQIHEDHIMVFSTHILQLAKDICDKIVLLSDKKLSGLDDSYLADPDFEDKLIGILAGKKEDLGEVHE